MKINEIKLCCYEVKYNRNVAKFWHNTTFPITLIFAFPFTDTGKDEVVKKC